MKGGKRHGCALGFRGVESELVTLAFDCCVRMEKENNQYERLAPSPLYHLMSESQELLMSMNRARLCSCLSDLSPALSTSLRMYLSHNTHLLGL